MLQLLHKYQKSVLLVFTMIIICVAMLSFGMTPYSPNSQASYAIKVNGQEITQQEFAIAKSNLENNYRQRFGDFYQQLIQMGGLNLQEQTIETLIEQTLLSQFSAQQDLMVSNKDLQNAIKDFFGANFSTVQYQSFLQNTRQTAGSFEARLAQQLIPTILSKITGDHLNISQVELDYAVKKAETEYAYQAFIFNPSQVANQVADPTAEELDVFYQDKAADYETPEKVSYNFISLTTADNLNLVDIAEEDLEIYYSENLEKFTSPEKVLVRSIILKRDPQNIAEDQASKVTAEGLITKIIAGEDFEKLAKANSIDQKSFEAKWVEKGKASAEYDAVAFDMSAMGTPKLVTTDSNYQIIRVEDLEEGKTKPLAEVSEEIKKTLQKRDVESYLQVKAEDLYSLWQERNTSLADFSNQQKLPAPISTDQPKSNEEDLAQSPGLSKLVLEQQDLTKQIHEIGSNYYLVEITEVLPSKIPDLQEVKAQLITDYKVGKSAELAKSNAEDFLTKILAEPSKVEEIKANYQVEVVSREAIKATNQEDELANTEIKEAIMAESKAVILPNTFQDANNKTYVIKLDKVTPPTNEVIQEKSKEQKEKLKNETQTIFMRSLIAQLKAQAKIEIAPSLIS